MPDKKRILVAPLDWGLGHATRCIPIIHEITALGHAPVIAADGRAFELLRCELPQAEIIRLKGYHPVYPENGNMVFAMAMQTPKFLWAIAREHRQLQKIICKHSIDMVISDNRYGLWSEKIPSALITHQIFIKMPTHAKRLERAVNRLNHFFINKYRYCLIPDEAGEMNLSGELSHDKALPGNARYAGIISRLSNSGNDSMERKYDLLVLLSGPEPQRTTLEQALLKQLKTLSYKTLVARGISEEYSRERLNENIELVSCLETKELQAALQQSDVVICRAGYSTLMELSALQKKAIIIPTPGQTEQEYLAERCAHLNYFTMQRQSDIDIKGGISELNKNVLPQFRLNAGLKSAISEMIGEI